MQPQSPQCPTWDEFLKPILEYISGKEFTRKMARENVPKIMKLSDDVIEQRLKSGHQRVGNRIGWAITHLVKAGLVHKVRKFTYAITTEGIKFLEQHKNSEIRNDDLKKIERFEKAWKEASDKRKEKKKDEIKPKIDGKTTPDEDIEQAYNELNEALSEELLETMHEMDPYKFEQLVVDLLFAMGYGGSREEAAQVTQKSNDGGIDGIINEDRLGLDVIYIQAKRYKDTIGRKEIQSFVGALAGKQANKGVFITTSGFKKTAIEYANNVSQKVVLINGQRLSDLMIEHDIGVSSTRSITIKRIDTDYFEES